LKIRVFNFASEIFFLPSFCTVQLAVNVEVAQWHSVFLTPSETWRVRERLDNVWTHPGPFDPPPTSSTGRHLEP